LAEVKAGSFKAENTGLLHPAEAAFTSAVEALEPFASPLGEITLRALIIAEATMLHTPLDPASELGTTLLQWVQPALHRA